MDTNKPTKNRKSILLSLSGIAVALGLLSSFYPVYAGDSEALATSKASYSHKELRLSVKDWQLIAKNSASNVLVQE